MRSSFRRRIAVLALAVPALALSACTNGFDNQTDAVYQPAVGVNDRSSEVDVLGALIVSPEKGKAGVFIASLANKDQTQEDKLTKVQGQGVEITSSPIPPIPAGGLVNLAAEDVGGIPVTGAGVKPGSYVLVRLTFENADPVTVRVPVVLDVGPYASITPQPVPTPNAVASKGAKGTGSPSSSASSTP